MQHDFYLKAAVLIVGMILSGSAFAGLFSSNLPQNGCLKLNLASSQQIQEAPSHSQNWLISNKNHSTSTNDLLSDTSEYQPARVGFYVGPANKPPASIVGQYYKPDLEGMIKYGFYLISTF